MVDRPIQIVVISPFDHPDAGVVAAASRAGALGVLDLGRDLHEANQALDRLKSQAADTLGVRISSSLGIEPTALRGRVTSVVLDAGAPIEPWADFRVFVQVTSLPEARAAVKAGAAALIAKGNESGGRVGDATSFVLLQSLVREITLPIWVQGGVGLNTAAACIAGGAAGVVLDSQVALTRESTIPATVKSAITAMDGSETTVVAGYRVFTRPDLPVHELAARGDPSALFGCADLHTNLLPAGQDAAFARPLADGYRTVSGIVRAIEKAIETQLAAAKRQLALAPASKLAKDLDIKFPIFQGPMTRVSDRAAFAEAVSDGGGLPFLALALMRGPEVQSLLEETAERLQGKTWGVGILGFVPPELREEQLEVVRRVKPPVALIAGGRPAQAKPLEEIGTATFLHVPSPGLLDMFLKQGARRFVFEGSECGGHVGPRTSFVLWQSQIERLLSHPAPSELSVIFAGGIHDARSVAMVAAMAAPLVERGIKIGVLMGTAYLTTREAVESGAIQPAFQQATLACEETALLETAPGHATRCADTEFVKTFRAERGRLEQEGLESHQIWERLEELNLGRLRIASKGLVREGDKIVSVDEDTQRREGMVMLGQVAALRDEVTNIEALHRDVSEGSRDFLIQLQGTPESPAARSNDIAIIGMSAIMPGAPDLETFWANIVGGVNSITEVPPERWRVDTFFDPTSMSGNMSPSKWGGFLDPIAFDPLTYGIPPLSLSAIEPVQLLALESSRRALADAGYLDRDFDRENTSVIFGAEAGTDLAGAYGFRAMWRQYAGEIPSELDAVLPRLTEDSFPGILANVIAGRIANRLDLGGVNYTVDAACASSLAALDLACKELVSGTSDMVLCGGADLHNSIVDFLAFASVHALSATGQCKPFDATADGIALGEGVATIVLKRLADAERDGDRIYSVIKAVGGGSDGRSLGLTAPRAEGQVRTLARAYGLAGGSPLEVELVEAHGTGTVVGDRTELETLNQFFGHLGAEAGSISLGSVKSQIGHTKCAAGLAGLIKASLSLYHRILPPTLNVSVPNPGWNSVSPFTINTTAKPWPGQNRKAGVSAFGFGGTNFHAVIAEYAGSTAETGFEQWPAELFLFRGASPSDAQNRIEALTRVIDAAEQPLKDLARSASEGSEPVQIAVVARDLEDLRVKLSMAREGKAHSSGVFIAPAQPLGADAKLAFLFPGQGSQRVGMLNDLFVAFPDLQRYLSLGEPWLKKMFPPTAWTAADKDAQRDAITDTRVAQPALGIAGLAAAGLLKKLGIEPDMLAGHSYGELVALCVAGAIPEADLLHLSELRGKRILEACGPDSDAGDMAAVVADAATTAKHLEGIDGVVVANENAPEQSVISGPTAGVATAVSRLEAAGITARAIPVAAAFHSPMITPACAVFAGDLDAVSIAEPRHTVFSNTTTQPYPSDPAAIRAMLAQHIGKPVRWASQVEAMYEAGARIFVEVGPGRVLTGLVSRILGDKPYIAVNIDRSNDDGIAHLLLALGQLAVSGVAIDADALYAGRNAQVFDLDAAPDRRPSANAWWVNGHRAWPVQGELPSHAMVPVLEPVVTQQIAAQAPAGGGEQQAVVLEYLRSVREMVEAQRKVMLSYLGSADNAPSRLPEYEILEPIAAELPVAKAPAAIEAPVSAAPEESGEIDIRKLLLAIVCERTGYPEEMLDLDLDLEADLSIDSIKRVEILGAVAERMGSGSAGGMDELPDDLVAVKTLRGIIEVLEPLAANASGSETAAETSNDTAGEAVQPERSSLGPVPRYILNQEPAWRVAAEWPLTGKRIAIAGARPDVELALFGEIEALGSKALSWSSDEPGNFDALIDLGPLDLEWSSDHVPELFARLRSALMDGVTHILLGATVHRTPTGNGNANQGPVSGGVVGMIKSLRKEWPDRRLRVANFEQGVEPTILVDLLLGELSSEDEIGEVGYSDDGMRWSPRVLRADHNGHAPQPLSLDQESVVLITGGARGITAQVAIELAQRFQCSLELIGRTAAPAQEEDPDTRGADDLVALRMALIARGEFKDPAHIAAAANRILAEREIRATLAAIEQAGARVVYHAVDVRDPDAFGALIDDIYGRYGRLDGIIHGAGVIEDKLARDKTPESFARVFETKVNGALTIAEKVRDDVSFIVFFSSIASAFGSRGQSDYAAANDFLDRLAFKMNRHIKGRVLAINWGPWRDAGMVSPELAREYARRGIDLIDPAAGVASFMDELILGDADDAQVILMRGDPATMV